MKISRRQFLGGGLLLATAPFVSKIQLPNFSNDASLEYFLKQYQSVVPLGNISNGLTYQEIDVFKKKLELILVNNQEEYELNRAISEIIKNDFENGNIRVVDGWIISETELSIELLKKQYV